MTEGSRQVSKAEATALFRRAGFQPDRIEAILAELPDPFDPDRDEAVLARHGVTRGQLMESLGGSP
jgi:hypothetical protein